MGRAAEDLRQSSEDRAMLQILEYLAEKISANHPEEPGGRKVD